MDIMKLMMYILLDNSPTKFLECCQDAEKFCMWCLTDFDYEGETVMMAPGSGFYSDPGLGRDEVRLAYVLDRKDLERAVFILGQALQVYPDRR